MTEAEEKYGDIIHLEHPTSKVHPRMPLAKRAAQFAPFAALSGYKEAQEAVLARHIQKYEENDSDEFYQE